MNKPDARTFYTVWLGQLVSIAGSGLSEFALGLWVYQRTGSIVQFGFVLSFKILPALALAPVAGMLVDRWDRRWTMILSDLGAAFGAVVVATLVLTSHLAAWHVYLAVALSSAFGTFQRPAFQASIALLVPRHGLGRAAGLAQTSQAVADIAAPMLAGLLLGPVGLAGILLIDAATFLCAAGATLSVRFPPRPRPATAYAGQRSLWRDLAAAAAYLRQQRLLVGLLAYFALITFLGTAIGAVLVPLVLGFATPATLGLVLAIAGGGLLLGGIVLSAWGGPVNQPRAVLASGTVFGLCLMLIGLRPSVVLVAFSAAAAHFALPFVAGLNQAIWQAEVPLGLQGRLFALREMLARAGQPLAPLAAGLLADRVFAPLLASGSPLAGSLGPVFGLGPTRGLGLMFVALGALALAASVFTLLVGRGAIWPPPGEPNRHSR